MSSFSDEELYSRLSSLGGEKAFQDLYERYANPLFRFIYRFTGNRESAEEILQDLFSLLLDGSFEPKETGSLKSWLYTVAKNKSLNHLKKKSKEELNDEALKRTPSEDRLEEKVIHEGLLARINILEKHLPQDLNETWRLRKAGYEYSQIAKELSIPVGTVKSRFFRLVEYFRKELK